MMPASNSGVGLNIGFPDVCNTIVGPATVPIPYPNLGSNSTGLPFCANVLVSAVPGHNMGTGPVITNGDEAGVAHATFIGFGKTTMGCPTVQMNGLPATSLLCPSTGNKGNNPLGAKLVPDVTNVLMGSLADLHAMLDRWIVEGHVRVNRAVTSILEGSVGHLRIACLSFSAAAQARLELASLKASGCRSLVLDLRGNPGGALFATAEIAGLFLPRGAVLGSLRGADRHAIGGHADLVTPLVVRIDGRTASSAEILAAALADHGRATLAGERTYGKGHIATLGGRPIGEFLTPCGEPIQGSGVLPNTRSALSHVGAA